MGKIVLIAIIIGVGYAWQKGGLKEWYDESIESKREAMRQSAGTNSGARQRQDDPEPQFQGPSVMPTQAAAANSEACARARSNIREIEQWTQSGGRVVEVGPKKVLSENETFSALAEQRRFIEHNCGSR